MEFWHFNKSNLQPLATTIDQLPNEGFIWIVAGQDEVRMAIEKVEQLTGLKVHERHIEDCLNVHHPSLYEAVKDYDILIIRSLVAQKEHSNTKTQPTNFLLFKKVLLSFSNHDPALERIKRRLESSKHLPKDPTLLLALLVDEMIDNFLDLRTPLLNVYNYWQKELFLNNRQRLDWVSFLNFKAEVRNLRNVSEEQQEVIHQWRQNDEVNMSEYLLIIFNDLLEHVKRIIRYSTQLEHDLDTLIQLYYSLIGNRTNDVVRILTVLSAIFLPLNLVASIFGMNFENLPLLKLPDGELIALFGMAILAVVLFIVFKWKKWI